MRFGLTSVLIAAVAAASAADPVALRSFPNPDPPLRRIGDDRFHFTGSAAGTALSADGRRLAVLSTSPRRGHATIAVFDVATRRPLATGRVPHSDRDVFPRAGLAFSPDGNYVAAAVNATTAFAIDAANGREVWRAKSDSVSTLAFCGFDSVGRLIRTTNGETQFIDLTAGEVTAKWPAGKVAAVSADGKTFARWKGTTGEIEIGDVAIGQPRWTLPPIVDHDDDQGGLALSRDGRTLAVVHALSEIHLYDLATGQIRRKWKLVEHTLPRLNAEYALAFSPDGRSLVLSTTGQVLSWNLEPFGARMTLPQGESEFVRTWQIAPDGSTLLLPRNGLVERWNLDTVKRVPEEQHGGGEAFALSPDGQQVVFGDRFGQVGVWSASTGDFVRNLPAVPGRKGPVRSLAVSPDGRRVALYRVEDGDFEVLPLNPIAVAPNPVPSIASSRSYLLAWSPDSRFLYGYRTERYRREFVQYDVGEAKKVKTIEVNEPLTLSPDGREWLYVGAAGRTAQNLEIDGNEVYRFDIATSRHLGKLPIADRTIPAFNKVVGRFSPDGTLLALGADHQVELLGSKLLAFDAIDVPDGKADPAFGKSVNTTLRSLAFTPNGRWLVTGGDDCAIKVWETATGKLVRRFDGHDLAVLHVAVSPDGRSVYSGGRDGFVWQWSLAPTNAGSAAVSEELWNAAGNVDPSKAVPAAWSLIGDEKHRRFVVGKLPPAAKPDANEVAGWLSALGAPAFADRQDATRELAAHSRAVESELREELAKTPSAEVHRRVEGLIARFDGRYSPEEVRAMRLVQACEWYRAKPLLETWATGAPAAALTREAKSALSRMK